MAQLAGGVVGPAAGVVRKSSLEIYIPILDHADLELILRSRVGDQLPVVRPIEESLIPDGRPEKIRVLREEGVPVQGGELDHVRGEVGVPAETGLRILLHLLNVVDREALPLLDHLKISLVLLVNARVVARHIDISEHALEANALAARQRALKELKAIQVVLRFLYFVELSQILANVITDAQLTLRRDNFIKFLILQLLAAEWIIALDLAALLLVRVNFRQREHLGAVLAGYAEGMYYLLDDSARSPNPDVLVAAGAVLVQLQPVFDASFAE